MRYRRFRITFGAEHIGTREIPVNGDGWVHLLAVDYDAARTATINTFGRCWSDLIPVAEDRTYPWNLFPAGQLHMFRVDENFRLVKP
jgi:hypothetical protein